MSISTSSPSIPHLIRLLLLLRQDLPGLAALLGDLAGREALAGGLELLAALRGEDAVGAAHRPLRLLHGVKGKGELEAAEEEEIGRVEAV